MLLEQGHRGERRKGGNQGSTLLPGVPAVLDGGDDAGICGGTADAKLLQPLHQRSLCVTSGRFGLVALRLDQKRLDGVVLGERRQWAIVIRRRLIVVDGQEAGEANDLAGGCECGVLVTGRSLQPNLHTLTSGVLHLGRQRALPDQFVQPGLIAVGHQLCDLLGILPRLTGRADGFMSLLGVPDLLVPHPRLVRDVVGAVAICDLGAGGGDGALRQRDAVGTHIRDVALLVEALGGAHGSGRRESELATGLLLDGRGAERRVGLASPRLSLHRLDREVGLLEVGGEVAGRLLVEESHLARLQLAVGSEVLAGGYTLVVDGDELGSESVAVPIGAFELTFEIPIAGRDELHPLALSLHEDTGSWALHPAGRQPRLDLLPQHRRHLVAKQAVENAPGLLGVDKPRVYVARVLECFVDGGRGDLVEHHPLDLDVLGLEHLEEVPGDALAFAVLVRRQVESVDLLDQVAQHLHLLLLLRGNDVESLEVVIDVDAKARPLLLLVGLRHVGGVARQVAHVPDRRLHDEAVAEIAGDGSRLGGRLNYDELFRCHGKGLSAEICCDQRVDAAPPYWGPVSIQPIARAVRRGGGELSPPR